MHTIDTGEAAQTTSRSTLLLLGVPAACLAVFLSGCCGCGERMKQGISDPFTRLFSGDDDSRETSAADRDADHEPSTWMTRVRAPEKNLPLGDPPWRSETEMNR